MSGGGAGGRELDNTPTWAVSLVCFVIILISIGLEKTIHKVNETFHKRKKFSMIEALEKIKAELMVLGFISLLLTFGQNYITRICIPEDISRTMLPCDIKDLHEPPSHSPPGELHEPPPHSPDLNEAPGHEPNAGDHSPPGDHSPAAGEHTPAAGEHTPAAGEHTPAGEKPPAEVKPPPEEHHRRLLWSERRILSADSPAHTCKEGYVSLISVNGLHQLHIFIFFLATFHVFYSAITMTLGRLKIRGWKDWERQIVEQMDATNDPSRFRLTHEDSFVKSHTKPWMQNPILFYVGCFFRHILYSVQKPDYSTLRHGFVSVHLSPGNKFDFQKYIKRSLEDDFKVVVGIPAHLWMCSVIYLLVNVKGGQAMFVLSVIPLVAILATGTKLQSIITQMAIEIQEKHAVVQGIPLVQVSDRHFWFSNPTLVLHIIHLVLFQNAFEITYFLWITYEFGLHSCFHRYFNLAVIRVCIGVGVQFLCSYITLPLYALVTQMGSHMKKSIFDEQTSKALMSWHNKVKKKTVVPAPPRTRKLGGSPGDSPDHSPVAAQSAGNAAEMGIEMAEQSPKEMQEIDLLTGP